MNPPNLPAWKRSVARAFDRAGDYDGAAVVQAQAADRLAALIARQTLVPAPRVLEIGCGTGFLTAALRARLATGPSVVSDIAPAMAARCRARFPDDASLRFLVMDGERPCLAPGFDLICSSLAAQWFADLPGTLGRLAGLLLPGGLLAVSTLAEGTFAEWHAAHAGLGLRAGTPPYPPMEALRALRYPGCRTDVSLDPLTERHADGRAFLAALRAIGAQTSTAERAYSPGTLRRVLRRFDAAGAQVTYAIATVLIRRQA